MHKPTAQRPVPLQTHFVKNRQIHVAPRHFRLKAKQLSLRIDALLSCILADGVHSYRKGRSVATAVSHISRLPGRRLSFDLEQFFPSIDQHRLKRQLDKLDPTIWVDLEPFLGTEGLPVGLSFSPGLSNLYLSELDRRFGWVRYCDNIVIVSPNPTRLFLKVKRHLADIGLRCHKIEVDPVEFCKQVLPQPTIGGGDNPDPNM